MTLKTSKYPIMNKTDHRTTNVVHRRRRGLDSDLSQCVMDESKNQMKKEILLVFSSWERRSDDLIIITNRTFRLF